MLAAGACRVGATATAAIGREWRERGMDAVAEAVAVEFEGGHLTSP
jgi:hypothetical protein